MIYLSIINHTVRLQEIAFKLYYRDGMQEM
jgi:hypothetical protein